MKEKISIESKSGITLIALIITIIILLILAGISISMITGENGILTQVSEAKEENKIGEEEEKVKLASLAAKTEARGGQIEEAVLIIELNKTIGEEKYTIAGEGPWTVTYKDSKRSYWVDLSGKVTPLNNNTPGAETGEDEPEVTGNYSIARNNNVTGYETLQQAIAGANDGDTIKVLKEITDNSEATIDKNLTINTNGKTLIISNTITVNENKSVTFEGTGTIERTTGDLITNSGTVTVSGTNLISTDYTIYGGTVKVISGNVESKGVLNRTESRGISAEKIEISDGNISGITYGITGGDIIVEKGNISGQYGISSGSKALTVKGGTIKGTEHGIIFWPVHEGGSATIIGGTIEGGETAIWNGGKEIIITIGNEVDDKINTNTPSITGGSYGIVNESGELYFYDGVIKGSATDGKKAIYGEISEKAEGYGVYNLVSGDIETATLKQGLVLNYDAKANTATSFSSTATNWYDRSGNNNDYEKNGILLSGATKTAFGWTNDGLEFDGTDDWVNTGIVDTEEKSERTYAVTFKPSTIKSMSCIIGNWEAGGGGLYMNSSGNLRIELKINNESYSYIDSEMVLNTTQIYKAVATYDGREINLYINGESVADPLDITSSIKIPDDTVIGIGTNPGKTHLDTNQMFNGTIYSAHVFDKALTADEVRELYKSEVARGR